VLFRLKPTHHSHDTNPYPCLSAQFARKFPFVPCHSNHHTIHCTRSCADSALCLCSQRLHRRECAPLSNNAPTAPTAHAQLTRPPCPCADLDTKGIHEARRRAQTHALPAQPPLTPPCAPAGRRPPLLPRRRRPSPCFGYQRECVSFTR
jgi:hypothetical protein